MVASVSILIIGKGWTGDFLVKECDSRDISFAATTTDGRDDTTPFRFDPLSEDPKPFQQLPPAETIVITFPILGAQAIQRFLSLFHKTHPHSEKTKWILLGATSAWNKSDDGSVWVDRHKPVVKYDKRVEGENELLKSTASTSDAGTKLGCVLSLAGLWGGSRQPRNWLSRVASTKQQLEAKGSLHLIHGEDVARAIVAAHENFTPGQRWLITDMHVYDWWSLAASWGATGQHGTWVRELLATSGIRALPRPMEQLQRALDSREFWKHFNLVPHHSLLT
ncbi:hypothetical protein HK102_008096 [Quaeritorhiza haematococci]|nr:hypothetical protein HK102_008096 [Quaeritorhiza haematococci]